MESHNGLSNGVNGTAEITVVEHSTTMEVKSIQSVSFSSQSVHIQETISQPGVVGSEIQPAVHQSSFISAKQIIEIQEPSLEIVHPEIQPAVQQPETIPIAVNQSDNVTDLTVVNGSEFIADALQQPSVVTSPQVVVGETELIADTSQLPSVVSSPQVVVGETEILADASQQPSVVKASQVVVGETEFIAQQPTVVTAPQAVVGGTGFVTDVSIQPQVITGGPGLTREVKDIPETPVAIIPGIMPGSSDFQVPQFAINALNQIAQAEGFTSYVINYERGSNFGDGFVAEIVRAEIKGTQMIKGVQAESELVLVLKLPPDNKTRREALGMRVFEREVVAYNEVLPLFQKFQLDKGLKPGQGFVSFPKCYYASYDKEKDEAVIIMEDIRKKGFKMQNKYKPVDFAHAKAVLETIAQLHGISLAMKDQCPGVFEKFKGLTDILTEAMDNDMMKSITALNNEKALETLEPNEENIKQKLRGFCDNMMDIVQKSTNGELSEPYSVINHGDCWINNMMFKYRSGFPDRLCLLDWQIVRYGSPVLDICYFIYLCTDSSLRAQHFDSLIQGYHIALRKQVELLGSDVNQIIPFTALLREMKSKAKFALSTALFVIPMLCTPNAELPNMDDLVESLAKGEINENNKMLNMSTNTESVYKKRMSGIIRDMCKKGYL